MHHALPQHTQSWPEGSFHVALTGHRSKSLPGGYDANHPFYHALYQRLYGILERGLSKHNHFVLHSGTALGADTVWAHVITALKQAYPGRFSFVAEVPLLTQPSKWPANSQQQWQQLVQQADHVNLYREVYHPSVLMKRNTGMIAAAPHQQGCAALVKILTSLKGKKSFNRNHVYLKATWLDHD